jgi:very-short-patch-repair endonuclease
LIVPAATLRAMLLADLPKRHQISALGERLRAAWDSPQRWGIIRHYYSIRQSEIMKGHLICPYELGLDRFLTPIETMVWQDVRGMGLPFYMQYPVGRRFVDFGDPVKKIAIEADGAAWHDRARDAVRDAELLAAGWWTYRIQGKDSYGERGTDIVREVARHYFSAEAA